MKPYTLHLGDCHEFIKTLPDASIDAVITDPPYHTTQLDFDKLEVRWPELWKEIYRVCKPAAVQVMFSAQPFTTDLINSNRGRFRYELIWEKPQGVDPFWAEKKPLRSHENVAIFSAIGAGRFAYNPQFENGTPYTTVRDRGGRNYDHMKTHMTETVTVNEGKRYPKTVMKFQQEKGMHPSQKPLELLCYLVKTYTNPGDTVLDLFAGSGTTGEACLLLNRTFIGAEIDPKYHAIAERRLEAAYNQPRLLEAT